MAAVFTPPQGHRALASKFPGRGDTWGSENLLSRAPPSNPQASRNQRRPDAQASRQWHPNSGHRPQHRGPAGGHRRSSTDSREEDTRSDSERARGNEEERRRAEKDLELKRQEEASLVAEVQYLRNELEKERTETVKSTLHLRERIEHEQREQTRMQMAVMKAQLGGSDADEEVNAVRQDVVKQTNEILEAMREIREQQQQAFKQVKSLSYGMLKACSQPTPGATSSTAAPMSSTGSDVGLGTVFIGGTRSPCRSPARSPPRSPPSSVVNIDAYGRGPSPPGSMVGGRPSPPGSLVGGRPSPPGSLVGGRQRSPSETGGRQRSSSLKRVPESEGARRARSQMQAQISASPPTEDGQQRRWFKQMQANLEQFGDVEVYSEDSPQECMCCNQQIASNYRVRPRKCNHVFHIECLLHWWTEGTCPVCHVSFAPQASEEAPPEARLTERSTSTTAARREAAFRQQAQHRRRRSPPKPSSPQSQHRGALSDSGFRASPIMEEAFSPAPASPVSAVHRTTSSPQPQQSNPL